ncbi:hypothetical protein POL68_26850 [Stigmatella sp. ncwal1]|uniref:Lipoprotein n=1 Tax=Stigmatella ashevillensis TaxID=2995309 RepID=A0ABT5DEX3_9BACT|nr:hypothetical protein [Stigmatella ashevillena]MDC0712114.1 hypothetical protein [Stigmatella ashevillena]
MTRAQPAVLKRMQWQSRSRVLPGMLLLGMTAGAVVACKTSGPQAERSTEQFLCRNRSPPSLTSPTIDLDCTGFLSGSTAICGVPGQQVTFKTTCKHPVVIQFTKPDTLFVGGPKTVTVPAGKTGTAQTLQQKSGEHCMYIGRYIERDCIDLKGAPSTGSLDVATSGGDDDEK